MTPPAFRPTARTTAGRPNPRPAGVDVPATAVIPTRATRREQRAVDPHLYRERDLCERFWSKVKQYRRVATRFEKKAANFPAFVKVAAVMAMLK